MSSFQVDTEQVRQAGANFDELCGRLRNLSQSFIGAISPYDACWGTDEIGKTVTEQYGPPRKSVPDAVGALADLLGDFRDSMAVAAHAYEGVDYGNSGG